jgi:hypothetical protein
LFISAAVYRIVEADAAESFATEKPGEAVNVTSLAKSLAANVNAFQAEEVPLFTVPKSKRMVEW